MGTITLPDANVQYALLPIESRTQFLEVSGDIIEHVAPIFSGDPKTAVFTMKPEKSGDSHCKSRSMPFDRARLLRAVDDNVKKEASLEESVGEVGFGKGTEIVIECVFVGFLGTKTVGFSGDQF